MRSAILIIAALVAGCSAVLAQAPAIAIEARGVPVGENLLTNPGFEDGAGEWPDGWGWAPNQPPPKIDRVWSESAFSGARSAGVVSESGSASGYWTQSVPVQPGEVSLLTCRVLLEEGTVLVRAYGHDADGNPLRGFDLRAYDRRRTTHPLAPAYWRPEWIIDMVREPWAPVELIVDTRGGVAPASISVQIGSYFAPGALYIDEVYLGPGTLTLRYTVTGAPLSRVRVLDASGGEQVTSGDLGGAQRHEHRAEGLALGEAWCVEAVATDRTVTRLWYPEAPEGAQ